MSSEAHLPESPPGYLSEESKRRFTLIAGILGAVFFIAQFVLPMVLMLLVMLPMMMPHEVTNADFKTAALWHDEVWFVENVHELNWREPERKVTRARLNHLRLTDLSEAPDVVLLEQGAKAASPTLLPQGDRLWVIGAESVSYYERGSLTQLRGPGRPAHPSRPFLYQGWPAVITLGRSPRLAVLHVEDTQAGWRSETVALDPPVEGGSVRELEVVTVSERQYLVASVCSEEPELCSLHYREMGQSGWLPLVTDTGCCSSWASAVVGQRPAVVLYERTSDGPPRLSIVTGATKGGQRQELGDLPGHLGWINWRAFSSGASLFLLSEGMPGSRKLMEIVDGKIVGLVNKKGSFPFGPNMMAYMFVPQCLPVLLSLALALILTVQMRKHRVQYYLAQGVQRTFASLWQRAWAQVIDAVVLGAGFVIPSLWMWRMFSDPETMIESGARFPLTLFGLFAASLLWILLVLVAFSYLEGRFGKTPGKWLLGIRVLGTDLAPCGFWRALVRNLLTFVDGFFNFLVGVLLVALTENWQRLGDLAARTLVVVDEKGRPQGQS
jgi:uncharacterized RDD family membrane protein YckC